MLSKYTRIVLLDGTFNKNHVKYMKLNLNPSETRVVYSTIFLYWTDRRLLYYIHVQCTNSKLCLKGYYDGKLTKLGALVILLSRSVHVVGSSTETTGPPQLSSMFYRKQYEERIK